MHSVELEFKRIQTYLFASPRLRAMLGANALLGRSIRIELTELARSCGAVADSRVVRQMPGAASEDPLTQALLSSSQTALLDNPAGTYQSHGVLVRDGGHFKATFADTDTAGNFISQANELITERLPGLIMEARLDGEKRDQKRAEGTCLFHHPGFQVSHHLGNQPAESRGKQGHFVGAEEKMMEEFGRTFRNNPSDLIGVLEQTQIIPRTEEPPLDLTDLTDGDYLALIHADGNSIGQRYLSWQKEFVGQSENVLEKEAHGECFFHSMRVTVRRALVDALTKVFQEAPKNYQILMLGGDDLLVACSARYALSFVSAYAEALARHPLVDNAPLSIGAGVAIAKSSFPFYRLHAMAETLADSAKQLYRTNRELGSVVDWHVTSNAWVDDPIAERRADRLVANAVLSCKPYSVLGPCGLQEMLLHAQELYGSSDVSRSQLRQLVETLRQGANLAELAWLELPETMRSKLESTLGHRGPFRKQGNNCALRISDLPDLVELIEISRKNAPTEKEAVQ